MQELTLTIGKRLLEIRKDAGMTQAAFAKKFGLSSRAYASYELGERELPASFAIKLNDILSIDSNWLLNGKGAKTSELTKQLTADAVISVRTFAMLKKLEIDPTSEAKLVSLLIEYFQAGGIKNSDFVEKILETGT